jgi:hypothetical protein
MLLPACLALVGFVIGVVVVARVSARVIAALGLELFPTLVWLAWPTGPTGSRASSARGSSRCWPGPSTS